MLITRIIPRPVFNAEGGAGGGGAGAAAAAADPGAAGASSGAGTGTGTAPPAVKNPFTGAEAPPPAVAGKDGAYFPEKLPEHLRGGNDRETLDKVFAAYSGAREELSKRGSAPKDLAEYKLDFGDDLKKVFGDPETSPEIKIAKQVAMKHGLTKEQLSGFVRDYHEGLLAGQVVKPMDPAKEARAILGDAARGRSEADIAQEAGKIWEDTVKWLDGMVSSKVLTAEGADALKPALETAAGVKAIRALRQATLEHALNPGAGQGVPGGLTKEDLQRRASSPEVDPLNPKFDPRKARALEEDYRRFYAAA